MMPPITTTKDSTALPKEPFVISWGLDMPVKEDNGRKPLNPIQVAGTTISRKGMHLPKKGIAFVGSNSSTFSMASKLRYGDCMGRTYTPFPSRRRRLPDFATNLFSRSRKRRTESFMQQQIARIRGRSTRPDMCTRVKKRELEKHFAAMHGYPHEITFVNNSLRLIKARDGYWFYQSTGKFQKISDKRGTKIRAAVIAETLKALNETYDSHPAWPGAKQTMPEPEFAWVDTNTLTPTDKTRELQPKGTVGRKPILIRLQGHSLMFGQREYFLGNENSRMAFIRGSFMEKFYWGQPYNGCVSTSIFNGHAFTLGKQLDQDSLKKFYAKLIKMFPVSSYVLDRALSEGNHTAMEGRISMADLVTGIRKGKIPGMEAKAINMSAVGQALRNFDPVIASINHFMGHAVMIKSVHADGKTFTAIDTVTGMPITVGRNDIKGETTILKGTSKGISLFMRDDPAFVVIKITDPVAFERWLHQ